jgi:hypothetical protein
MGSGSMPSSSIQSVKRYWPSGMAVMALRAKRSPGRGARWCTRRSGPPVLLREGEVAALAREAGRHLRAHVAEDLARHAHVAVDQLEHRLHRLAAA